MKKICFLALFALCIIGNTITSFAQSIDTTAKYSYGSETYPGVQPGEVFFTVISNDKAELSDYWNLGKDGRWYYWEPSTNINFSDVRWKTKRMGYVAYSRNGELLEDHYPVFVKKDELIKAGVLK